MTAVSVRVVLLATALVSLPVARAAMDHEISIDTALERVLIGLVVCWVGTAIVVGVWRHNRRQPVRRTAKPADDEGVER